MKHRRTVTISKDALKLIQQVFEICQNEPERNRYISQVVEAKRLDVCIQEISDTCGDFLARKDIIEMTTNAN